jgi:hypothetical protein
MALSVINQLVGVVAEFSAIAKIRKYRGLHEGHHFILMAMEVHLGVIWIISLRNVPIFSTINDHEVIYLCLFAFNFLSNMLVLFFNAF